MTHTKELQYQARIRELREALAELVDVSKIALGVGFLVKIPEDADGPLPVAVQALSRPDDLSALDAYVREEKRKVLREVAGIIRADKCSGESGYAIAVNDATEKHADAIEKIAEGLK